MSIGLFICMYEERELLKQAHMSYVDRTIVYVLRGPHADLVSITILPLAANVLCTRTLRTVDQHDL